jgi:hypothetical protein
MDTLYRAAEGRSENRACKPGVQHDAICVSGKQRVKNSKQPSATSKKAELRGMWKIQCNKKAISLLLPVNILKKNHKNHDFNQFLEVPYS